MGGRWKPFRFQLHKVSCFIFLMLLLVIRKCSSLDHEGLVLLEFRERVETDPHDAFVNWNPNDGHPCMWFGVQCVDGKVHKLDLQGLSLGGTLAPGLGNLSHLRSLVLNKNHFSGVIPKEIGGLTMLELLDLRNNNLSGTIPAEIGRINSLKRLLLCNNKFQGSIPRELGKLHLLSELELGQNHTSAVAKGIGYLSRKFGHWFRFRKDSWHVLGEKCCGLSSTEPYMVQNVQNIVSFVRRRLLQEPSNLPAVPASDVSPAEQMTTIPTTRSSGAFPAIQNGTNKHFPPSLPLPSPSDPPLHQSPSSDQSSQTPVSGKPSGQEPLIDGSSETTWKYVVVVPVVALFLVVVAALLCTCRNRGVTPVGPWKTGLSGQLQKAFVSGVPKLNRPELEIACEDFSNIILTLANCTVFKGTLSSGVEIAVASTEITSSKDWLKGYEITYRKKIDTLSRVNHKNFVNLLGYCEEEEPFLRMMVFEYAPNGSLFEHLHVQEAEHLDWNARMRIIMGTSYCLQYMHHDLNPPVAHINLDSSAIFLTDDYAAKVADINSWTDIVSKRNISNEDESEHSELPPLADPETNVYSFGILLLEIISGRQAYSKEQGSLVDWAAEFLNDKRNFSNLIDPTLKNFKNTELDIICEIIQECIHRDPRKRPTMKEVASRLREVIGISPDAATPRLSPLWWAELEILSVEA